MKKLPMPWGFYLLFQMLLVLYVPKSVWATESLTSWQVKLAQSGFAGTVFVANTEGVIFNQSFGLADRENKRPFDENTVFDIGSLTKQFMATAVLLLAEQGKLRLTSTLDDFFSEVPADNKHITIHQLLSHSAGLPTNLPNHGLYDKVTKDRLLQLVMAQELRSPPGQKFHYSNLGYSLLSQVIAKVSGQDWETYIRQNLLLPAGLLQTGYRQLNVSPERLAKNYGADQNWLQRVLGLTAKSRSVGDSLQHLRDDHGDRWFEGAGGFLSTIQDMHAWFLIMHSEKILTKASWQRIFHQAVRMDEKMQTFYGYGWAIDKLGGWNRINHTGSNGYSNATFDYYPEIGLFIFTASNEIDHYPDALIREFKLAVLKEISKLKPSNHHTD